MTSLRLATYNVEWFTKLFNNAGQLFNDDGWSGRWDVTRSAQTAALAKVFRAIDADAIMVIEAPDTSIRRDGEAALETFAAHAGLRTSCALIGYANDTKQEIALLYDPNKLTAKHAPLDNSATDPAFDSQLTIVLGDGADAAPVRWSKPPLEVTLMHHGGRTLHLIGVHAKSKTAHGDTPDKILQSAITSRRKQLAQCTWLRRRVDYWLHDSAAPLIVMGDFNDGPGLDVYETLFGQSGVEIVLGKDHQQPLFDPHAAVALANRIGAQPAMARFHRQDGPYLNALLDYIMVSPAIRQHDPKWHIWHPFDDPTCYENLALREALLTASDHFPVTLDLVLW